MVTVKLLYPQTVYILTVPLAVTARLEPDLFLPCASGALISGRRGKPVDYTYGSMKCSGTSTVICEGMNIPGFVKLLIDLKIIEIPKNMTVEKYLNLFTAYYNYMDMTYERLRRELLSRRPSLTWKNSIEEMETEMASALNKDIGPRYTTPYEHIVDPGSNIGLLPPEFLYRIFHNDSQLCLSDVPYAHFVRKSLGLE